MDQNKDVIEIDLKEIFYLLLHRLWLILLIGILGASAFWAISKFIMVPVYTSTTMVYVINRQDEERTTYSDLQMGEQLTKDYSILVKSRPVTEQVVLALNIELTHEELADMIEVNNPGDTRILEISVKYTDPAIAKEMADTIASVSSERMVSIMEMEKVNVLEPANLPSAPSEPKILRYTLIGGAIGVFITAFTIILNFLLNDTIRTSEDVEKYLGLTTLGIIPLQETKIKKIKRKETKESYMVLES